jgi:hypothetical protein
MAGPPSGHTVGGMNPRSSSGGTGLLAVVAAATISVVIAECLVIALSSYWVLGAVLIALILAAVGVVGTIARLIDRDEP